MAGPAALPPTTIPAWRRPLVTMRSRRNLLLVDQRGTGGSNELRCKDDAAAAPTRTAGSANAAAALCHRPRQHRHRRPAARPAQLPAGAGRARRPGAVHHRQCGARPGGRAPGTGCAAAGPDRRLLRHARRAAVCRRLSAGGAQRAAGQPGAQRTGAGQRDGDEPGCGTEGALRGLPPDASLRRALRRPVCLAYTGCATGCAPGPSR